LFYKYVGIFASHEILTSTMRVRITHDANYA